MLWQVEIDKKILKKLKKLPDNIRKRLIYLIREIEENGPARSNWINYSKLGKNRYHCHLKKGHPTYVAIWEVRNKQIRLVEVTYVGTHEKARY